jgi:transcription elongation factor GreB
MSRAFVREDARTDAELVPPRAPLPEGVANRVTRRGHRLLLEERRSLEAERDRLQAEGASLEHLDERLEALAGRIAGAEVVASLPAEGRVVFGVTVGVVSVDRAAPATPRRLTIVGVDEADPAMGRVAFVSPVARALEGARVGDEVRFEVAGTVRRLRVVSVEADPD